MRFRDRAAAGRELGLMLKKWRGSDALVVAIPAGGVPVAAEIASALDLPLGVAPVSKVLLPWTTESGYGAVAFDGTEWIDQEAVRSYGLTAEQVAQGVEEARAKVNRRTRRLSHLKGRTLILVDDGIAAGSTMRTAIAALRKQGAAKVVVAVPTAHRSSYELVGKLADDICCPDVRSGPRFAVADAYQEWRDLSDAEIEALLKC
jgi:putative phosphoribosyl transferase